MSSVIPVAQVKTLRMSIYRYDPSVDDKPYMQDIDVEVPNDKDIMVLDALHLAKAIEPSRTEGHVEKEFVDLME